jgi:hypothetical protein
VIAAHESDDEDELLDAREDLGYRGSREAEPDPDDLGEPEETPPAPAIARTGEVKAYVRAPNLCGARGDCRHCNRDEAKNVLLYPMPGHVQRTACHACVGKANRDIVERTRTCIRQLKAAAAIGNSQEERTLIGQLRTLVGAAQADQTVAAIRARLSEGAPGHRPPRGGGGGGY